MRQWELIQLTSSNPNNSQGGAFHMQGMPTVVDIEASGFGANSYPIEVGIAKADGKTACYLICPQHEWSHWDPASERLHGLKREQLVKFGSPVADVARSLNQLLGTQTVYSDAWGVDQGWMNRLFECAGVRQHFRMEALQYLFSERQYAIWNQTLEQVFAEYGCPRHRASHDALVIQQAFVRSAQSVSKRRHYS